MSGTEFQTFMVGGLGLLVAAALSVAWLLWRQEDTRREAIKLSLEGIGHEFRFNMFQTVRELADIENGRIRLARDLPVLAHPQLDAVLAQTMATDKRPLAAIQATYQNLEAAKRRLRFAMDEGEGGDEPLADAKAAAVHGISTLYLWEKHEGAAPERAHSTRSWWVRDWMKQHGFAQDLLPGLALRDSVVDTLRSEGMVLTPKPLALSAHDYYSRHYDRSADPRGVFGKRRTPKVVPVTEEAAAETPPDDAETVEAEAVEVAAIEAEPMPAAVEAEPVSAEPEPAPAEPAPAAAQEEAGSDEPPAPSRQDTGINAETSTEDDDIDRKDAEPAQQGTARGSGI